MAYAPDLATTAIFSLTNNAALAVPSIAIVKPTLGSWSRDEILLPTP
jgi:hypothetical protein